MTERLRDLGYDNLPGSNGFVTGVPDLGPPDMKGRSIPGGMPEHIASAIAQAQQARPKPQQEGSRSNSQAQQGPPRPQSKPPKQGPGLLGGMLGAVSKAPSRRNSARRSAHDDHIVLLTVYRGGSILVGMAGYILVAAIESKLTNRVLPPQAYPGFVALIAAVVTTGFLNGVQTAYRNAENDDGLIQPVGILAYLIEFILILLGMLIGAGYNLPWLPGGGGSVPLTWFDLAMSLGFTLLLTVASEPLVEYGFTGIFRPFGRRF